MPNCRYAFICVNAAVLFFSCNGNKTKKAASVQTSQAVTLDSLPAKPGQMISFSELSNQYLESIAERFTVPHQRITQVTGTKGLKITIDPVALEKEDGTELNGPIHLKIIELTSSEDFFKTNATTVSNGRLLVSGGSYYVGMESDGTPLHIKNGKSIRIDLPVQAANSMQLFYGRRNESGAINWEKANEPLFVNGGLGRVYNPPFPDLGDDIDQKSKYYLYDSINSKVYFSGKQMTVREMVDTLNKRGVDKIIDTVYFNWGGYRGCNLSFRLDNSKEYASKYYRVISRCDLEKEKDSMSKARAGIQEKIAANQKYATEWEKTAEDNSMTTRLQKYYSPASIGKLGWINCDGFYNNPIYTDLELDLPLTLNSRSLEYFIIYRDFNGLVSGQLLRNTNGSCVLKNLPVGEKISLVSFVRDQRGIYENKTDFVIEKNKRIQLEFKSVSETEMHKMFGTNVRI